MSKWSSYINLVGPAGIRGVGLHSGSANPTADAPASPMEGDFFLNTSSTTLIGPYSAATGWPVSGTSLIGPQGAASSVPGPAGAQLQYGSGAPSANIGIDGAFYIDSAASAIYGPKAGGSWPTSSTSLIGPRGPKGDASTVPGPPGTSLRSGPGAPSASNPSVQYDGDFFLSSDSKILYGPRANGAWPTSGVNVAGNQIRTGSGGPDASVGNMGDAYIDLQNGIMWPPKTIDGWVTPPISLVGPTGPSGQVQPMFGTFSTGAGPAGYCNVLTLSATPTVLNVANSAGQPSYFVPITASAFMGACIVNFSASAGSVTFQLFNQTTNTVVYTSSALVKGTVSQVGVFDPSAYPMAAGNVYVWQVTGSGSASAYVVPMYLYQCGAPQGVSTYAPFTLSGITLSGTANILQAPGVPGQTMYYRSPKASYLYSVTAFVTGTITANITFGGNVISNITAANSPQYFGPYVAASLSLAANTNYTATVTGSGTGNVTMIPSIVQ